MHPALGALREKLDYVNTAPGRGLAEALMRYEWLRRHFSNIAVIILWLMAMGVWLALGIWWGVAFVVAAFIVAMLGGGLAAIGALRAMERWEADLDAEEQEESQEILALLADIDWAVADFRKIWPEPHGLSANLKLAARAANILRRRVE